MTRFQAHPLPSVLFLSLALFLSGNWILPLMDRDEPRFAEASREMSRRHDLLIPWFNGNYRFDKPPLIYWCQMASFGILGENPFAARLPSALFASATSLLLVLWGRRFGNAPAGFFAAIMFLSSLQVLIHARLSVADMPMICFFTAAVWSGWELTRPGTHAPGWWWMFYSSLALGFLAKGPVAWLPLGILLLARWRNPQDFSFPLGQLFAGLLVMLAILGCWGIPALQKTHGQFFAVGIGRHVIQRSFGIMEGHGASGLLGFVAALPLYFLTFFPSFFPWSLKVPRALTEWWASRRSDIFSSYLLAQAALVFAVFTLVRTKLPHYTLPAFPCLALWLGVRVSAAKDSAAGIARGLTLMIVLALVLTLGLFTLAAPRLVTTSLWRQARPYARPEMAMGAVAFSEPSLVWEFHQVLTNRVQQLEPSDAAGFLSQPAPRVLVLPSDQFQGPLRDLVTNAVVIRATGIDTVQFKRWDLTAVIKR